jgi:hypothetical protein
MSTKQLLLTCPYCGTENSACFPQQEIHVKVQGKQNKGLRQTQKHELEDMCDPDEISSMPYTRDVGKFDPDPDEKAPNDNPKYWSRIGKDFLRFFLFQKIGILRQTNKYLNVRYRVCRCVNANCERLFDVFLNYTIAPNQVPMRFADIWPHLPKSWNIMVFPSS